MLSPARHVSSRERRGVLEGPNARNPLGSSSYGDERRHVMRDIEDWPADDAGSVCLILAGEPRDEAGSCCALAYVQATDGPGHTV